MKKYIISFFLLLTATQLILAVDLNVEKLSSNEVMILGADEPAVFNLDITNNGETDSFIIYTFFGSGYSPREEFTILQHKTKNIQFKVSPPYDLSRTGANAFDYYIQGKDGTKYTGRLNVQVIELKDAFEIGSNEINPETSSIEIYIKNKVNLDFEELDAKFSSAFFELEKIFSLSPKETKTFEIILNKEEFKQLNAGFYTIKAEIDTLNKTANVEGVIKFAEKGIINTDVEERGFIIRKEIITKTNNGNTAEIVETEINKNIISRLFTSFAPQPDNTERQGAKIIYKWNRELKPGEKLEVKSKTNWFLPLIFVILIVAVIVFIKEYTKTNLKITKKTIFVKSKGGEFALKISLLVHAKEQLDNVIVIDRIPLMLKLYDKFGGETPVRVDEKNKKIEWEFKRLEPGEKRMMSYVAYSKIGVIGKFALPRTASIYERAGKINETQSNKVFFITEQRKSEF